MPPISTGTPTPLLTVKVLDMALPWVGWTPKSKVVADTLRVEGEPSPEMFTTGSVPGKVLAIASDPDRAPTLSGRDEIMMVHSESGRSHGTQLSLSSKGPVTAMDDIASIYTAPVFLSVTC